MLRRVWLLLAVLVLSPPVMAADIRATSGEWRPIEIIVEPFGDDGFADIIAADLNRSGDFRATIRDASSFGQTGDEDFAAVRALGGEYLLVGQVRPTENKDKAKGKELKVFFQLADAITGEMLEDAPLIILFDPGNRRLAAHSIGNWIVKKIARKVGVFHTKVAYVLRRSDGMNELKIADYDGHNAQTILTSQTRLISPAWTPDGNALLYVSFEHRKPVIYWQSLLDGICFKVAGAACRKSAGVPVCNAISYICGEPIVRSQQQLAPVWRKIRLSINAAGFPHPPPPVFFQ